MMKCTLLNKQIRFNKPKINRFNKSLSHSFLRKNPNVIESLSHNNSYFLFDKEVSGKSVIDHFNKNKPERANSKLSDRKAKIKQKLKKWATSKKSLPDEQLLYSSAIECLDTNNEIPLRLTEIASINGKISRFNDKQRALIEIKDLQNKILNNSPSAKGLEIVYIEHLFKIPELNKVELSGENQREICNQYYKKYYPEYPLIAGAIHRDEGREHYHYWQDGKNNRSRLYDFPDAERRAMLAVHPDKSWLHTPVVKMTDEQRTKLGELKQIHFYKHANVFLKNNGDQFRFHIKRNHKQRAIIKQQASMPIAEREYNLQNKLKSENTKLKLVQIKLKAGLECGEQYLLALAQGLTDKIEALRQKTLSAYIEATLVSNSKKVAKRSIDELEAIDQPAIMLGIEDKQQLVRQFKSALRHERKKRL